MHTGTTETDRIVDELRRAYDGDPWHGPATRALLEGVTAEQAAARPIPGAHTIAELVAHMTAWTREVARRLRDGVAREPEDGDWPPVDALTPEGWAAALDRLGAARRELLDALEAFPPERLDERVGDERTPEMGTGVSYAVHLHGVAQHDAYHSGQIALLRKALGA